MKKKEKQNIIGKSWLLEALEAPKLDFRSNAISTILEVLKLLKKWKIWANVLYN